MTALRTRARRSTTQLAVVALAIFALGLTACSSSSSATTKSGSASSGAATATSAAATSTDSTSTGFPRTITIPAGKGMAKTTVTLKSQPKRIAALSYEPAEMVAELGLSKNLVVVPAAVLNPALTNHLAEMKKVASTIPTESAINAEAVIAKKPDLVLMSARHGMETGVGKALEASGIPVIILPNSWSSLADLDLNTKLIGQAIGADDAANKLIKTLDAGLVATKRTKHPRILVLGNQAGRPFVTAGAAFPLDLVKLAGGTDVSSELGLTTTGPITAEQIVKANPDGIVLIDMNGSGEKLFASVMKNGAVARLSAVKSGHVLLIQGRLVQALGMSQTVTGLGKLNTWIDGLTK